jgi:hypothetical protein
MGVDAVITFRIPMAIQLIPGGALALGTLILRESPTLLWRKGKREQAIKNLCYLRQLPADHEYMLGEVGRIEARLEEEDRLSGGRTGWVALLRGSTAEMKTSSMRYRLYVPRSENLWRVLTTAQRHNCWNVYVPELVRLHLHQVRYAPMVEESRGRVADLPATILRPFLSRSSSPTWRYTLASMDSAGRSQLLPFMPLS